MARHLHTSKPMQLQGRLLLAATLCLGCAADAPGLDVDEQAPLCPSSTAILDEGGSPSGYAQCAEGPIHRVDAVACEIDTDLPGDCAPSGRYHGTCADDADCSTQGDRCMIAETEAFSCSCQAGPECHSDADCDPDQACFCDGLRSTCIAASCRVDADCDDGTVCALSDQPRVCRSRTRRLACIDAEQPCLGDADCDGEERCQPDENGAWTCAALTAPPCG